MTSRANHERVKFRYIANTVWTAEQATTAMQIH